MKMIYLNPTTDGASMGEYLVDGFQTCKARRENSWTLGKTGEIRVDVAKVAHQENKHIVTLTHDDGVLAVGVTEAGDYY